ncbi:MerR family transcriptional regulator [Pararhizobium sp.]|uniref:MerR family transcriptional regulator n=1 Tax=Pararhizobium sp. TaxID=1977563 RepID=UPI003FA710B2
MGAIQAASATFQRPPDASSDIATPTASQAQGLVTSTAASEGRGSTDAELVSGMIFFRFTGIEKADTPSTMVEGQGVMDMRIGDLARRSGLSASRIRFYEARSLIPPSARRDNGYRDYPEQALSTLQFIAGAQRLGFSLSEIRRGLSPTDGAMPSDPEMIVALRKKLVEVETHIREAKARRSEIIAAIDELASCP